VLQLRQHRDRQRRDVRQLHAGLAVRVLGQRRVLEGLHGSRLHARMHRQRRVQPRLPARRLHPHLQRQWLVRDRQLHHGLHVQEPGERHVHWNVGHWLLVGHDDEQLGRDHEQLGLVGRE
jgi:hypothetical protein